jgi:signal transduction histidine kinase
VTALVDNGAGSPVRVLLVDDEPANLLALEAILDGPGLKLVRANSGEEALRYLLRDDFAVILLDVKMAGLDGFETARLIRARERSAHTPIIFLTAYDSPVATVEHAYTLGAVDYLVKPIIPAILRAKVAGFVELFRRAERIGLLERAAYQQRLAEDKQQWELDRLREEARRRDEFLAVLSHELRNPLAPLRNVAQVLRLHAGADAVVNQIAAMLERQVGNMVRLVDDLLDVSRIARGKIELRRERVELGKVVAASVESTSAEMEKHGHLLEVRSPGEPLILVGDSVRLEQIFTNLLVNAGKFMEAGGSVVVTLSREQEVAVVRVADTGMGIRAELLPRLFDVFQQGDRLPGGSLEGLGLGLTLVKRLTELHGGTVTADSEGPGRGSVFTVRLPLSYGPRVSGGVDAAAGI